MCYFTAVLTPLVEELLTRLAVSSMFMWLPVGRLVVDLCPANYILSANIVGAMSMYDDG